MAEIEHPLQQTFVRINQLSGYMKPRLGAPQEDGWIAPALCFAPASERLAAMIATTQRRLRTETANLIGSALLQAYQWPLTSTAIAGYLLDRRVPDLSLDNVQMRFTDTGEAEAIAFTTGRFAALPDDPAADHPDAHIVANPDSLRDYLRIGIETHLGSVIDQLVQLVGCAPRGLWLSVADRCAGDLAWLMQQRDKAACSCRIEQEVYALIRAPGSPLVNKKVGLFQLTYKDHTHVYLERATCCYWYKTEDGDYCSTCPHRTKADRNARLFQHMAEQCEKVAA